MTCRTHCPFSSFFPYFRSDRSAFRLPHAIMASIIGIRVCPNGVMAYINIPRLKSTLPIYHYTTPESLQKDVGHLRGSALPVGGKNTHAVLSAHRGLPTSRLFTDLDKVRKGDHFYITVLNRTLAYEVDRISVVKPDQTKELSVQPGKDLVTLVTCTPYGVNTQRLLVRGHRVENESEEIRVTSDAMEIDPLIVAPAVALPMLLALLFILLVSGKKKKSDGGKKNAKTE